MPISISHYWIFARLLATDGLPRLWITFRALNTSQSLIDIRRLLDLVDDISISYEAIISQHATTYFILIVISGFTIYLPLIETWHVKSKANHYAYKSHSTAKSITDKTLNLYTYDSLRNSLIVNITPRGVFYGKWASRPLMYIVSKCKFRQYWHWFLSANN